MNIEVERAKLLVDIRMKEAAIADLRADIAGYEATLAQLDVAEAKEHLLDVKAEQGEET